MEWTEEKCLELTSAYEKQEILRNVKHPQHYNKLRRYDAWEEVAGEMGVDAGVPSSAGDESLYDNISTRSR
jgi:hypothetical protein